VKHTKTTKDWPVGSQLEIFLHLFRVRNYDTQLMVFLPELTYPLQADKRQDFQSALRSHDAMTECLGLRAVKIGHELGMWWFIGMVR